LSGNSERGNSMKTKGIGEAVINYFTKETGAKKRQWVVNLNNEADESEEEIQEKRAMGRDRAKAKKKSSASSHDRSSSFVDLETERREAAELKREKLAIQRRTLEVAEREKQDRDILFYNSVIDPSLPAVQQEKLLEMKLKIKERYNLDY
nr:hypothetical protein [Tanacetum cinerariifolium]